MEMIIVANCYVDFYWIMSRGYLGSLRGRGMLVGFYCGFLVLMEEVQRGSREAN